MLKPACYWLESEGSAYLRWNYGTVAVVRPDGEIYLSWGPFVHQCRHASHAQARQFVERWVAVRRGFPGQRRVRGKGYG
jgi:hypothetical protein